jgi:hypothetical protein
LNDVPGLGDEPGGSELGAEVPGGGTASASCSITDPRTTTVWNAIEDAPLLSVARSATTKLPFVRKDCMTVAPAASSKKPSPSRSHVRPVSVPSGSLEFDANVTGSPGCGAVGEKEKEATGGRSATTLTMTVATICAPLSSVARRRTTTSPGVM